MWKYQLLLNQNLQILITILVGMVVCYLGPFDQKRDLPTLVRVVFNVLLPSAVLQALGIKSNLRDGNLWRFVGGFLLLRAFWLVLNVAYFGFWRRRSLAFVTINWMAHCWVSTVVLGIPLLNATLGAQYGSLGAVAAISSFIFQLPLMLIFFEGTSHHRPPLKDKNTSPVKKEEGKDGKDHQQSENKQLENSNVNIQEARASTLDEEIGQPAGDNAAHGETYDWFHIQLSRSQASFVAMRMARNPILWSILIGIILSVTTLGPKYLDPGVPAKPNCSYAVGAGFISMTLQTFAACTEPIALLAVGIFLVRKNPFACGYIETAAYMIIKLILVPALMVGCAFAVGLEGAEGRAAVLLASLPVSPAAYTLAEKYEVGQDIAESNIFFGNLLVLPTTIAWVAFMDSINLFNAPAPASPTATC